MENTTTQELLAQAEKLCAQRNVRLTPQRLEVLRLMSLQEGAISAYDLLDLLRETEPQAKPPDGVSCARFFCLSRVLFTRSNPPTATCSVTCSISRPIARPCLSATVVVW
ncbi:zinc uptake transcriptional repressor [Citrobacter koseri]|uniref:Zinc uptake transcriptional repressor n=1 Tax=Citrobacter koseri TaxID=545 RepID=A0A3S4J4Z7_CITKO|nr:zinc uptake transcriptional repressor [Citrobacter koseri]